LSVGVSLAKLHVSDLFAWHHILPKKDQLK